LPDVLALETVPDIDEAEALMAAISGLGISAWLSYSIAGGCTRAGQPLAEAFAVAASVPEVVAVGVNCCAPADVLTAIAAAREVTGKPVIVYPGSGEDWDARRRAWTGQVPVFRRAAAAVDSGGRENRGRVLPGPARSHRGDRQGRGGRRPCARQLRLTCPAGLTAGSASSAHIKFAINTIRRQWARRFEQSLITQHDENWPNLSAPIDAESEHETSSLRPPDRSAQITPL